MKNLFLSIIISLITMNTYSQEFNLNKHQVKIKSKVKSAAYFNDKLYCVDDNGTVFHIDSLSNINYISNTPASSISIHNIDDSLFVKTKNNLTFYYKENEFSLTKKNIDLPFFEDEEYFVERSCKGEWGGSVYFTNKSSKKKYECAATCPIIINKINGSYIVTASLSHLSGFCDVLQINDPMNLTPFQERQDKGFSESRTTKGAKLLVDSMNVTITTSFLYNNNLYHIISGSQGTSLCKIKNNKFEEIVKISECESWSYSPINVVYNDGTTLSLFENYTSNGIFLIKGNKISMFVFNIDN